jgi:hypothetical protein
MDAKTFHTMMGGIKVLSRLENRRQLGGNAPSLLVSAQRLAGLMLRAHMVPGPVDIAAAIDPGFEACLQ